MNSKLKVFVLFTLTCSITAHICETRNPCLNGATCSRQYGDSYKCECIGPWRGIHCDSPMNKPQRRRVRLYGRSDSSKGFGDGVGNNVFWGNSWNNAGSFNGAYAPNWNSYNSFGNGYPCAYSPCLNQGVCQTDYRNPSAYSCSCMPGYYGKNCENSQTLAIVLGTVLPFLFIVGLILLCFFVCKQHSGADYGNKGAIQRLKQSFDSFMGRERPNDPIDEMSYPMYTSPTVEQRKVNEQKSPNGFHIEPNQQVHLQTVHPVCEQKKPIPRPMV